MSSAPSPRRSWPDSRCRCCSSSPWPWASRSYGYDRCCSPVDPGGSGPLDLRLLRLEQDEGRDDHPLEVDQPGGGEIRPELLFAPGVEPGLLVDVRGGEPRREIG